MRPKKGTWKPHPAAVRMRALRLKAELTQEQMAAMIHAHEANFGQVALCQLESGEIYRPTIMVGQRIEKVTKQLVRELKSRLRPVELKDWTKP